MYRYNKHTRAIKDQVHIQLHRANKKNMCTNKINVENLVYNPYFKQSNLTYFLPLFDEQYLIYLAPEKQTLSKASSISDCCKTFILSTLLNYTNKGTIFIFL